MKVALLCAALVGLTLMVNPVYAACNPDEGCSVCLIKNIFTGGCSQHGNDPVCEARKAMCQQCANIKVAATGLSYACVACVMSTSPANPGCAPVCGGAAKAHTVAVAGNCG